ncbi:MAG: geranylgeranyl reductase family protein [Omnitrophica WOR_2 bacterium]
MNTAYDVVVIGAGPAGSVAARRAAESGLKVLLVEKRQEIGAPVRCAEAIGMEVTRPFIEPDPRWIDATVNAFAIYNSCGESVQLPPTETTLVINRKVFDFQLALLAARAGAEVRTSTAAVGLEIEDQAVKGVKIESLGRSETVRAKLVVAADGTESQAARWAGLKTVPPMADYFLGVEFLLAGLKGRLDSQVCEYHLNLELAPGGYLWVFPKGEDTANVGLVMTPDRAKTGSALSRLEQFVAVRYPHTSLMAVISGAIPATGAIRHMVTDGLLVVGDAAHQADPLTAGGINLGMIGADLAMQAAVPCVQDGDTRAARLQEYEKLWHRRFGKDHQALYRIRKTVTSMNQIHLDELVRQAARLPISEMSLGQIMLALLKNDPLLLLEARSLLSTGILLK